jgi:outer membrane protein with beta-barrel domain
MKYFCTLALLIVLSCAAFSQQDYVPRYEAFAGYTYFTAPSFNLVQRGFNVSGGVNLNSWLTVGGDYSWFEGHSDITISELTNTVKAQLVPLLPLLGPNPVLPFDSTTYTFTVGPQFNYRHFKRMTLFIRPVLVGLHESATLKATSPALALAIAALAPGGKKTDLQPGYGVGGGIDLGVTRHLGLHVTADYVHVSLFSNLLAEARNGVRLSVGPNFKFGRNVAPLH